MIYYACLMVLLSIGITIFYSVAASVRLLLLLIAIAIPVVALHVKQRVRLGSIYRKIIQFRYAYMRVILLLFTILGYLVLSLVYFHVTTVVLFMVISYFILFSLKELISKYKDARVFEVMKLITGVSLLITATVQATPDLAWVVTLILGSFFINLIIMLLFKELTRLSLQNYVLEDLVMVTLTPLLVIVTLIVCSQGAVTLGYFAWFELFLDGVIMAGTMIIVPYILLDYLVIHSQNFKYRVSMVLPLVTIIAANLFEVASGVEFGVVATFTSLLVIL